jgi:hypothetical protein
MPKGRTVKGQSKQQSQGIDLNILAKQTNEEFGKKLDIEDFYMQSPESIQLEYINRKNLDVEVIRRRVAEAYILSEIGWIRFNTMALYHKTRLVNNFLEKLEDPKNTKVKTEFESVVSKQLQQYASSSRELGMIYSTTTFKNTMGPFGYLGHKKESLAPKRFSYEDPEVLRLIRANDAQMINIMVGGRTGSGKTNFTLQLLAEAIKSARGYTISGRRRIRIFTPNFIYPDFPEAYSYHHIWDIFKNDHKQSFLWSKYDYNIEWEENGNKESEKPTDIVGYIVVGEVSPGKLSSPNSDETVAYRTIFKALRQMRGRMIISTADQESLAISVRMNWIDPYIEMVTGESENRYAVAEYLDPTGSYAMPPVNLGIIPLHSLTAKLNKGMLKDMTGDIMSFSINQMYEYAEKIAPFEKDPDSYIDACDHYVHETFSKIEEDEFASMGYPKKEEMKVEAKKINYDPRKDDSEEILM